MANDSLQTSGFNDLAADYERYRIGYSPELFDVLEPFGIRRGAAVLDAGCGTGLSAGPLVGRGVRVTGVDSSPEMLAIAKRLLPDATFVDARVEGLPFADAAFDGAISAQTFHWFDADRAFAELMRVIKPGGPIGVWWKILGSDDALRDARAAAARMAGVEPTADPLRGGFAAFYRAPFAKRSLRVLPFAARFSVDEWIGYERSRAISRDGYRDRLGAYLDALRSGLEAKYGPAGARFDVRYTQYLYIGECPK